MPMVMTWDIATTCGIVLGPAGGAPKSTTLFLGGKGKGEPEKLLAMKLGAADLLSRYRPDILAYEAPLGGTQRDLLLGQLVGVLIAEAMALQIRPVSFSLQSVRKHFIGKHYSSRDFPQFASEVKTRQRDMARKAIKRMVMDRCAALGWDCHGSDDEGDALALWDCACATLAGAQSTPVGGLFEGMRK